MRQSADANTLPAASPVGDEGRLVAEMRSLKSHCSRRARRVAKAVKMLEKTNSSRVRNAAALALADLRAPAAKDKLIDLLSRPDTRGSRGSLLYALDQLGADVPLAVLAEIIVNDSYEAREEALTFIVSNRIQCSAAEFARAKAVLEEAASASADSERLLAIREALAYLREK